MSDESEGSSHVCRGTVVGPAHLCASRAASVPILHENGLHSKYSSAIISNGNLKDSRHARACDQMLSPAAFGNRVHLAATWQICSF